MCDMGGHHFGGQPRARFGFSQVAFRLFERGYGRRQGPVGRAEFFCMRKQLAGQFFGSCPQHLFRPFGLSDVGIDGHPPALGQGRSFYADRSTVGAGAFDVVRLKRAGLFGADFDEGVYVFDFAVVPDFGQIPDGVFK